MQFSVTRIPFGHNTTIHALQTTDYGQRRVPILLDLNGRSNMLRLLHRVREIKYKFTSDHRATLQGAAKKWTPKVFCCFLSNRLEL